MADFTACFPFDRTNNGKCQYCLPYMRQNWWMFFLVMHTTSTSVLTRSVVGLVPLIFVLLGGLQCYSLTAME